MKNEDPASNQPLSPLSVHVITEALVQKRFGEREPNLTSQLLAVMERELPRQWEECFGYQPLLAETFIDPEAAPGRPSCRKSKGPGAASALPCVDSRMVAVFRNRGCVWIGLIRPIRAGVGIEGAGMSRA